MWIYILVEAIAGIIVGILLAARTRRTEGVVRGRLDNIGVITNFALLPLYLVASPFCMALSLFSRPNHDGFLGLIGWAVTVLIASAPLLCGLGLGASVAFRKIGKSRLGFAVQFVGVIAIVLTFVLFTVFYGNLLAPLSHPNAA